MSIRDITVMKVEVNWKALKQLGYAIDKTLAPDQFFRRAIDESDRSLTSNRKDC